MDLESLFRPILDALNISAALNLRVVGLLALLIFLGEANIQIPLLIEAIWLLVGYQLRVNNITSVSNLLVAFLAAQAGRQIGISLIYLIVTAINTPLSRFLLKYLEKNKYFKKYRENESFYTGKFLVLSSATLGMLTPLNSVIKILLIAKRKLKILLVGTLLSGMAFDAMYIAIGAIFHTTTLQVTYLPLFLLVGFFVLIFIRVKVLK